MRTHLLRGVVLPFDLEDGQLGVSSFDVGGTTGGGIVVEVRGFDHRLPCKRGPFGASEICLGGFGSPVSGSFLTSFFDDLDRFDRLVRVAELMERFSLLWVLDRFGPFAAVCPDKLFHLFFQISADPEFVFQYYLPQVFDPSRKILNPSRGSL